MEIRTFYSENIDKNNCTLTGEEFIHAVKVDRIRVGDQIRVINNTESEYFCKVKEITKCSVILDIIHHKLCESNPKTQLDVYLCLLKGDKNDNLIAKLSELGVTNLHFVTSQNVDRKNNLNFERLNKLAITSAKQCGRSKILNISGNIISLNNIPVENYNNCIVFYEGETKNTLDSINFKNGNTAIIIGSEGGFVLSEIEMLKNKGAVPATLGKIILRAETAAVVGTTLINYKLGGFTNEG